MLEDVNQRCLNICLQPLHAQDCITLRLPFLLALILFVRRPYVNLAEHKLNYPVLIDVLEVAFSQEKDTVLGSESFALCKQMLFGIDGIMCSRFICSEQDVPRIHPVFFFLYW